MLAALQVFLSSPFLLVAGLAVCAVFAARLRFVRYAGPRRHFEARFGRFDPSSSRAASTDTALIDSSLRSTKGGIRARVPIAKVGTKPNIVSRDARRSGAEQLGAAEISKNLKIDRASPRA
jgi:hypothetical protein